jgi:fumarate reductase flavoprotein subunit
MPKTQKLAAQKVNDCAKSSFEIPPPPIPAKSIKQTLTFDVVVVGAGIAGLTAAASAAEAGAKVALIEKGPTFHTRGLHNAAFASRMQKQLGIQVDKEQVIYTIMEFGGYRGDQRLVKLWADNCDQVMDWLLDLAQAAKIEVIIDMTTKDWYFPNFPLIHVFRPNRQDTLAQMLLDRGRSLGAQYFFDTPAVQLLRRGQGRITGLVASQKDGSYLRFNASKGVILCTGDYAHDREMVAKYCNWIPEDIKIEYATDVNTGDGHKMGMWVGAAIDDLPHCPMLFDFASFADQGLFNIGRQPWLYVNADGQRFMNEDIPWGYECNQILGQPGHAAWSVWDSKYPQEIPVMHSQCCKNMGPPTNLWNPKQLVDAIARGGVLTADSLEELGRKMQVPLDTFQATVKRYNQLVRGGKDMDFGKHPDRLTTLEKPTFYACKMEPRLMVVLSGLKVNTDLQVLDTNRQPIPGLYAAGNTSGSFFGGNVYSTTTPGVTHSRAWTFGRLAGLRAAAEK